MLNSYAKVVPCLAVALGAAGYSLAEAYKQVDVIPWAPLNTTSVDQSTIYNNTYYLSDRVNKGVHVISLSRDKQSTVITGFRGLSTVNGTNNYAISGPNGLLVLPDRNELYVGDGDGNVKVIDLFTNSVVTTISTGSKKRADEMAYDAKTGTVVVTLPNDNPPAISIISAQHMKALGQVVFRNASGLEQPAFNSIDGLFYISVPSTGSNAGGEIAGVNASTMKITRTLPLDKCIPAGIVFGPQQDLFISCSQDQILKDGIAFSQVMDVASGDIKAKFSGIAGVDQVAYDSHAKLYFAAAYQNLRGASKTGAPMPQLAVIDAQGLKLLQTIVTDNVTAHSVAVDQETDQCVVPLEKYGIAIYNLSASASTSAFASASASPTSPVASSAGRGFAYAGPWVGALALFAVSLLF